MAPTAKKCSQWEYPPPLIVLPSEEHKHTFIILHGRGSTGPEFAGKSISDPAVAEGDGAKSSDKTRRGGTPLLRSTASNGQTLQSAFPHAKLIFLTASKNRATIYKSSTHQWFDNWYHNVSAKERLQHQYLQIEGLGKSVEYVHGVLRREIAEVGGENVVLWGMSQGCATSLVSLLTWEGRKFAGVIGMCGYLPFATSITEVFPKAEEKAIVKEDVEERSSENDSDDDDENEGDESDQSSGDEEDADAFVHSDEDDFDSLSQSEEIDEDPFASDNEASNNAMNLPERAIANFREDIEMGSNTGISFQSIPVFLGHGTKDEKVDLEDGREAKKSLDLLGVDVQLAEYEGLGHWFSEKMLADIFGFLREKLRVQC